MEIKNYFAQDAQGNIMPSANCYLYLPGTTTLATGLVDGNGIPISNPFHASGMGQITFGAPNGVYDLRVALGARDWTIKVQCADIVQAMDVMDSILGSHAENPTTRNNGQPLEPGDETWNSTDKQPYWWNGTAWVALNSSAQHLEESLADPVSPENGAAKVARSVVALASILSILTAKRDSSLFYLVRGYIAGTSKGGGRFYWDASRSKSQHDGRSVISPTVPWNGAASTLPAFLDGTGETVVGGSGCFVRIVESSSVEVETYGGITSQTLSKAISKLDTGNDIYTGGKLIIPTGQYAQSEKIIVDSDSANSILGVTMQGMGKQATTLNFSSQPAGQNGLEYVLPIFASIKDMGVRGSKKSGVALLGAQSLGDNKAWNHVTVNSFRSSFNTGAGLDLERGFMGAFKQGFTTHNGTHGVIARGFHTSLHFDNWYSASNAGDGYNLTKLTYSCFTACAADLNAGYAYRIQGSSTLGLRNVGAESTGRSAVGLIASAADGENRNIVIDGLLAFNNNTVNAGYPNAIHMISNDGKRNYAIARGCRSHDPKFPVPDAIVNGIGAELVDSDNDFPNGVQSANGGYIHHVHRAKVVRGLSVTGVTDIVELMSPQGHQGSYGGEILIQVAGSAGAGGAGGDPSASPVRNTATYKLLVDKSAIGSLVLEIAKVGMTAGTSALWPSFTWAMSGNKLTATPIGSTSGSFYFEILASGFVKIK